MRPKACACKCRAAYPPVQCSCVHKQKKSPVSSDVASVGFLAPPPTRVKHGYGGGSLTRRTAAHDTPSLDCELCLCVRKKGEVATPLSVCSGDSRSSDRCSMPRTRRRRAGMRKSAGRTLSSRPRACRSRCNNRRALSSAGRYGQVLSPVRQCSRLELLPKECE